MLKRRIGREDDSTYITETSKKKAIVLGWRTLTNTRLHDHSSSTKGHHSDCIEVTPLIILGSSCGKDPVYQGDGTDGNTETS